MINVLLNSAFVHKHEVHSQYKTSFLPANAEVF